MASYNSGSIDYSDSKKNIRPGGQLWNDLARAVFPDTISDLIALSAHLYEKHGVYRQGLYSAVSYFVTDMEVRGLDDDIGSQQRSEITKFLNNGSGILEYAPSIGSELLAYGTAFITAHIPFERLLLCPHCGSRYQLREYFPGRQIEFELSLEGSGEPGFRGPCPNRNCESRKGNRTENVIFEISDVPHSPSFRYPIRPILMPPQIMRLSWSPTTGERVPVMDTYRYQELVEAVNGKSPEVLYDTRWDYIRSIAFRKPLIMDRTSMKVVCLDPSAPEIPKYKGWGCPQHLSAFPYAAQLVLLDTYNEIAAAEFSMPRRVISPPQTGASLRNPSGGGGAGQMSLDFKNLQQPEDFKEKIQSMMSTLRNDPSGVGVSPYALQYQILGAESSNMITKESLEYAEDRLLRAMGIIPELYKGGLEATVATPSMFGYKLFEKKWKLPVKKLNEALDWLVDRYEERLEWPALRTNLASTAMQNDPRVTEQILMRNQAGLVSDHTANKILGLDGEYEREMIKYEQDLRQQEKEEKKYEDAQKQMNRDMVEGTSAQAQMQQDQQAVQGTAPGGGAPAGPPGPSGGTGPVPPEQGPMPASSAQDLGEETGIKGLEGIPVPAGGLQAIQNVHEMKAFARVIAKRLLPIPLTERESITSSLSSKLPNLHTFVMTELDNLEQEAQQMGVQAAREGVINPAQQ